MVPPIIPVKQATLQSPDGKMKTIVDVGSGDAASLQSKGWTLGAPPTAAVVPVANALTQSGNMAPTGVSPAPAVNPTQQAAAPAPQAPTAPAPAAQPSPQAPMQQPAVQPMPPAVPPATPTTVPTAQPQQATLQSPDGQSKVVVTVGSGEAAQLQSQGWTLGAPANASVETAQQALNPAPANTQPNANTQQDLTQQDITQQDQGQNLDFSSSASDSYSSDPITHELLSKYGITPPAASGNPVQDYADTYNHLITSMGLMDIKSQFNEVQKKYSALQNELNDKISSVNDDPWLSEGMRVAQIKSVQDKYQGKLQILDDQQKLYDSLYQQGVQQAQYVANAAFQQQQFNTQTAFNTAELALKEQESKAALKSANLRDQLSVAQDMRQAAEDKSKNNQDVVDNARASLALIANTFGENVFSQMSAAEKRKWEQSTGMPTGTLDHKPTGLQPTIAQRVDGWQNGYVFDSSGNPVADVSKATADDVANAIMTVESKGNFNLTGGSGEKGAFQFMPATWNIISQQYAKATGINMSLPQTPDNEDKVARWKIGQLLDAGNTPEQVAMIWNGSLGGSEKPIIKSGINQKSGVKFDTQKYANSVINVLRQNISGTGIGGDAQTAQAIFNGSSTLKLADLPIKERAGVAIELNRLKDQALQSGDITGIIRASAGGSSVDSTAVTSFEKAIGVLNQLGDLKTNITKEATGPIMGIIRSNNSYDAKAQLIKAQLAAIIPNLAKGVYGEVGVLTDNDIANYARTLPSLNSTEDVANAVLGMTIRNIQNSLESKIKIQAGLGRDVSGLGQVYEDVKAKADQLLGSSGVQSSNTAPGTTSSGLSYAVIP